MSDCSSINDKIITNTNFNLNSFKEIVSNYLNCKEITIQDKKVSKATKSPSISCYAGIGVNYLSFTASSISVSKFGGLALANIPSIMLQSGFSIETFPSNRSPGLSVLFDLGVRHYSTSNSVSFNSLATGNGTQSYDFEFSYLRFSPYFRTSIAR